MNRNQQVRRRLGMPTRKPHTSIPVSVWERRPDLLTLPTVSAEVQTIVRWSA